MTTSATIPAELEESSSPWVKLIVIVCVLVLVASAFGMLVGFLKLDGLPSWVASDAQVAALSAENHGWVETVATKDEYWSQVHETLTTEQRERVYLGALQLACGAHAQGADIRAQVTPGLMFIYPGSDDESSQIRQLHAGVAIVEFC